MNRQKDDNLYQRIQALQSQKQLIKYLNSDIINKLIHLFDNKENGITKYIENERKRRGLETSNIVYKSQLYGDSMNNPTLLLEMIKNNKVILHLSIHLKFHILTPKSTGFIHISKNSLKSVRKSVRKNITNTIIHVEAPPSKSKSLNFSIDKQYLNYILNNLLQFNFKLNKTNYKNLETLKTEITQEVDIIITVLNKLFDETSEYYIGNSNSLMHIHDRTDTVLQTMDTYTEHATRKNKGVLMGPFMDSKPYTYIISPTNKLRKVRRSLKTYHKVSPRVITTIPSNVEIINNYPPPSISQQKRTQTRKKKKSHESDKTK